jgi:hypothetical protein
LSVTWLSATGQLESSKPGNRSGDSNANRQPELSDGRLIAAGAPGSDPVSEPLAVRVTASGAPLNDTEPASGSAHTWICPARAVSPVSITRWPRTDAVRSSEAPCTSTGPPGVCCTQKSLAVVASASNNSSRERPAVIDTWASPEWV